MSINLIIATTEFETQRKLYSKVSDAYGCLGILRIPVGMISSPNIDGIKSSNADNCILFGTIIIICFRWGYSSFFGVDNGM